jgi:hypothetical protein
MAAFKDAGLLKFGRVGARVNKCVCTAARPHAPLARITASHACRDGGERGQHYCAELHNVNELH